MLAPAIPSPYSIPNPKSENRNPTASTFTAGYATLSPKTATSELRVPIADSKALYTHGLAQCWSWDYDPDDDWVYVVSTSFKRDTGIILRRVRPAGIGDQSKYSGWGFAARRWAWDNEPTPITPGGETWGELSFRRLAKGTWVLGGFVSSKYALGYRVVTGPTANMYEAPIQTSVTGSAWNAEDHALSRVAQLYGGYVLPGSRLDVTGGVGLVVSQWKTDSGWPYRAMQFTSTLRDTTRGAGRDPADPINL